MTAYAAIADSDIDPESPGTTTLFTRLRDNPIAQAEGTSPAPPIANAALAGLPWQSSNIGTNQVLVSSNIDKTIGSTGSHVFIASATWVPSVGLYNIADPNGRTIFEIFVTGSWRAPGIYESGLFWFDGTNMRIRETAAFGTTVYYQKMS